MKPDGCVRHPRNPDHILALECSLLRVLDLTISHVLSELGTTQEELIAVAPSRFAANARGTNTPTQQLGLVRFRSRQISSLKVPSVLTPRGYRLDILLDCLILAGLLRCVTSTAFSMPNSSGEFDSMA